MKDNKGISRTALILIIVLVLVIGAISVVLVMNKDNNENNVQSGNTNQNNKVTNNNQEQIDSNVSNDEISLQSLLNHKASPESDFFCTEDGNGGIVLQQYEGNDEIVVIPETYRGIPIVSTLKFTFANSKPIKALKYPNNLKEVAEANCTQNKNLEIVVLGNNVQTINKSAFMGCENLKTVILNEGLKTIGEFAFGSCYNLKSIYIPESVTNIHFTAFNLHHEDFVIEGKSGSVAETYAKENNITFVAK